LDSFQPAWNPFHPINHSDQTTLSRHPPQSRFLGMCHPSRQAALEKVKELGATPRLATGDYGDLVRALKKVLQKDSIVPVAVAAADVAAVLASGLRDSFSSHAKVRPQRG
jgi:hypothetical protein